VEKDGDGEEIANRTATVQKGKGIVVGVESWADERSKPVRSSVVGTLELRRIASIEPSRLVRVWLPAGYQDSTQSYPVLYLLDGQNVFDRATSAIGEEWGVDETLTELIERKAILPMIVVAIDNSTKRVDEYTWIADGEGNRKRGGNAESFAKWLAEELKPKMDREYRTQAKRDSTWIGGSSLGGLFSLYSVIQNNETFGRAIAMSPSLSWGNEGMNGWIESSRNRVTKPTNVWVDFGGKEGTTENGARENVERFERFQRTLSTLGQTQNSNFTVGGRLFPDAKHNESAWRERFAEAIQFIAK
jgi:predicted alpha/beta superfamily hydrolase